LTITAVPFLNAQWWGLQGFQDLINIHPLFVHFPIALFTSSLAFYLLGSVFKTESLLGAGKWCLYFGTLAAGLTVWTGLQAAETVSHAGAVHDIMEIHETLGITVLSLALILSGWVFFSKAHLPLKARIPFLIGMILLVLILIQGADLGGRMVFLHGVGVGKKSMLQQLKTPEPQDHHMHEQEGHVHH